MTRTVRADGGRARLDRGGDAGDQPAAADAEQDGVEVGHLVEELEAERALPDDDVAVVERVDEHGAGALGELGGQAQRRLDRRTLEHDVGAVAAGGEQLGDRHAERHEDRRGDAEGLRGERDALRVVAGGCGHDAARALLGRQAREPVGRAADLERAGALEVLELQVHGHAEQLGQVLRLVERRARDDAIEEGGGILELRQGGDAHVRTLLGRGTVVQMRSSVGGRAPVSHARLPR